jgi:xylulokinase
MPSEPSYLLGIDLGTSAVKVGVYSTTGERIALESDEYALTPQADAVEADPELYWGPVVRAVRRVLGLVGGSSDRIVAVSTSTFGESVFPMLKDGTPARPSISWMDGRSSTEADLLVARLGAQHLLELSGQADINAVWPATKFLWMKHHEPEVFARVATFLLPNDYLLYRLSGQLVAELSMWGSSLLLDIRSKAWSEASLEAVGISRAQLPTRTPPGTVLGTVSAACAAETGLSMHTLVVAGAMDQMCAAVGAGNIVPGIVTESTGTVVALLTTLDAPVFDATTRVPCHIHAVPGKYCLLPWSPTGGMVLKWFKDRFGETEIARAGREGRDVYDLLCEQAAAVPPGSDGLILLPFLEGAGFPEFHPAARGVLLGLSLTHTKAHLTRAILESIAYLVRADLEALQRLGVSPREVRLLGGAAKSPLWSQIKADVLGLPVSVLPGSDTAALGAAMIAAVGAGLLPDLPRAVAAMGRPGSVLMPQAETRQVYDHAFSRYRQLFEHVKVLF